MTPASCRAARAFLGWSQTTLAERAGVAKSTVADYERGARTPIHNNLAAVWDAFKDAGLVVGDRSVWVDS